jgi:plasmid stabilization system protein ParE
VKTSIQPAALADLRRGFHFYERQEAGVGAYFLDSLYSDIDSLRLFAGIHSVHFGKFYRLLSKRFPFAVYYDVKENSAFVRAVLDLRRDPAWIAEKLEKRK